MKCPKCGNDMVNKLLGATGVLVVSEDYLEKMWKINQGGHIHGGTAYILLPMKPKETKFTKCEFCETCEYVCFGASDIIPSDEVPQVAK